jgi:uncharacterized protein (TIGR02300 family)
MPAKDLGVKHTCWKCGAKFYDLKKADAVCPKCGTDPRVQPAKPSAAAERRRPPKEAPVDEAAESLEESEVDEDLAEEPDEVEETSEDEG